MNTDELLAQALARIQLLEAENEVLHAAMRTAQEMHAAASLKLTRPGRQSDYDPFAHAQALMAMDTGKLLTEDDAAKLADVQRRFIDTDKEWP